MADLIVRFGGGDVALLERLAGLRGAPGAPELPDRVVVDAHVAANDSGQCGRAAELMGVPYLVDPQTIFWQDSQPEADPWTRLPFGRARAVPPVDLLDEARARRLVAAVVQFQVQCGVTSIIAPYVHVSEPGSPWQPVQFLLWRLTREHVRAQGITRPLIAVASLGWRCLHPTLAVPAMGTYWSGLRRSRADEVALAASGVDGGARPVDRLVDLLLLVESLAVENRVLLWNQGRFGEAAVAAGASGYETGIGWRERCDVPGLLARHRRPVGVGHPPARPVFVQALSRSVPKRVIEHLHTHRTIWEQIICPDPLCCAPGGRSMLGDARAHAIIARARSLHDLDHLGDPSWRWNYLANHSRRGLDLAGRIERLRLGGAPITRIDTGPLDAVSEVAGVRRHRRRGLHTA